MSETPLKVKVFYDHPFPTGCPDGAACAYIAYSQLGADGAKYIGISHGKKMEEIIMGEVEPGDLVYFMDIAPTLPVLEKMLAKIGDEGKAVIIDHHETTRRNLGEFCHPNLEPDINKKGRKSAAGIVWEHFERQAKSKERWRRPHWISLISGIDLHDDSKEDFYFIAAFVDKLPKATLQDIIKAYELLDGTKTSEIKRRGRIILDESKPAIQRAVGNIFYADIKVNRFVDRMPLAVDTQIQIGRVFPSILMRMADKEHDGVAGCFYTDDTGTVKLSLRSNDGQALAVAEKLLPYGIGSGGHPNAAVVMFKDMEQLNAIIRVTAQEPEMKKKLEEILARKELSEIVGNSIFRGRSGNKKGE